MRLSDYTFGIVGLGLMGGSLAKAIRGYVLSEHNSSGKILGCDINSSSVSTALTQNIIDEGYDSKETDVMLSQCDFVYVCLYPHMTVDFLIAHKNAFKSGAIVTDISGVKNLLFRNLNSILRPDIDFIPGHPMAGSEREGYLHSNGEVFKNRNYILIKLPSTKKDNFEIFKLLILTMGFSRIIETDYVTHDHKIAFTSQLCHVIASALVDSAEDTDVTAFGGGSFEDLTRIAMINAPLWSELFLADKDELLSHIERFEKSLNVLKQSIVLENSDQIEQYLENVRVKRTSMSRIESFD